jgi:peptidoglycan/LPS O-acetylase OafA/YrhL
VRLGKVRGGEVLALIGALCVIVSLTLFWYEGAEGGALDAWDTFGPAIVLLLLAAGGALAMFASALAERSTAVSVSTAVWALPLSIAGVVSAVVRLLERPEHATGLCAGPWLAFAGALAILAGAWRSIGDERGSLYRPATPEARPRP